MSFHRHMIPGGCAHVTGNPPAPSPQLWAPLDAAVLGLSRSEYVRRRLAQDAAVSDSPVSTADLERFASIFSDLADPDVMSQAWQ